MNDKGPIRNEPEGNDISWVVKILPYVEETTLYRLIDQPAGAYASVNAKARAAQIRHWCPSDSSDFMWMKRVRLRRSSYAGCHHDIEAPIDDRITACYS